MLNDKTMTRQTSKIASADLLNGDKLYLKRARMVLPYIVRQAKAGKPIYYSKLAEEIGIPNARNLNYPLGSIGKALKILGEKNNIDIPKIQCLVINIKTQLPGDGVGWFISKKDFSKFSRKEKQVIIKQQHINIFAFPKWDWVLAQLKLSPVKTNLEDLMAAAGRTGGGIESEQHIKFKEFILNNPSALGLDSNIGKGELEKQFPSSDRVDVFFNGRKTKIGVEVKSKISNVEDIARGLFQCVKYKCLIEATQAVAGEQPNSRVILALEGKLPSKLVSVMNILEVEVIDNIKIK